MEMSVWNRLVVNKWFMILVVVAWFFMAGIPLLATSKSLIAIAMQHMLAKLHI
jgi:hypothetical protein